MITRRSFVKGLTAAPVILTPSVTQARGSYQFVEEDGGVVLSSVDLQSWYDGSTFTVELYVTPTIEEIEWLRLFDPRFPSVDIWSHVDMEFTIFDLDSGSDEARYSTDASGFVRYIDDDVSPGPHPTVRMIGFNLNRWQPGRQITMTVEIDGYTDGNYPPVMVDMMSTVYFPDNGTCSVMPGLEDNRGNNLCAEYGRRFRLVDRYGETQF